MLNLCCHCCILLTLSWQQSRPVTSFTSPPPQALFPCGWPVPGRPAAQGVCPLPATQRTPTEPALALLAAEPGHLWQKQSPQHFSSHHPLPVLHGELESWTDPVEAYEGWWWRVVTGSQLTPHTELISAGFWRNDSLLHCCVQCTLLCECYSTTCYDYDPVNALYTVSEQIGLDVKC